jgi:hypothetical protein
MLTRVSQSIRPATRRRLAAQAAADFGASGPLPSDVCDLGVGGGTEEGLRTVLKGKPSAVIKRFVEDRTIDLLVIPVTAQAALRRMDKESKRGTARSTHACQFA